MILIAGVAVPGPVTSRCADPCAEPVAAAELDFASIPLAADGVVLATGGRLRSIPVGSSLDDDPDELAVQDSWVAEGTVPGPARYADMAERALRDLDALVLPNGAALAGATGAWRYVWPRDASFTAVALARTGHVDDARSVLVYLQRMQDRRSSGGVLEARYLANGSGDVPDGRGLQLDGNGWVLWAVSQWYAAAPPGAARDVQLAALRPLVERSLDAIRDNVDPLTGLPGTFPDYWEVVEDGPTLATLAPLLLGARSIGPVLEALGLPGAGDVVWSLEQGLTQFAPDYTRRIDGQTQDAGVALLMPPFAEPDDVVRAAWTTAAGAMVRPAGGLAPGSGWRLDGVSWTPTTALFALTAAASGDVERAHQWLEWLDEHRTTRGSLPEKVLWDGEPSAVAPLAWTDALVLLTLDELDAHED